MFRLAGFTVSPQFLGHLGALGVNGLNNNGVLLFMITLVVRLNTLCTGMPVHNVLICYQLPGSMRTQR